MKKIRSLNWTTFFVIIKSCLIGLVATLIGIIMFALVLKFANLSSTIISYINDIIKTFAMFIMVMCIKRKSNEKLLLKSIFAGIIYEVLTFLVFSILNGSFDVNVSFIYDLLFAIIVSAIVSVVINILNHNRV